MQWINVKDRLPEDDREVKIRVVHESFGAIDVNGYYDEDFNVFCDLYCLSISEKVTHWCEITEPKD